MSTEHYYESIQYEPLTLWLDDLDELEALLRKQSSEVTVRVGKKTYNSYSEFTQNLKGKTIFNIEIKTVSPMIAITMIEGMNRLSVSSSTLDALGTGLRVDKILRSRYRTPPILYDPHAPYITTYASWPFMFSGNVTSLKVGLAFLAISALWWIYIYWSRAQRRAMIKVFNKYEASGIAKEYLPAVIIAIIAAIAGAIVSKLL